jgi:hypothetical protein
MIRIVTTAAVLGMVLMATAANSAEIVVQIAGKSPAEIRTAIARAAHEACTSTQSSDYLSPFISDTCVRDTIADAMSKIRASETAMNTRSGN